VQETGRRIRVVLVVAAVVGAITYVNWLTSPREFRGTLVYKPGMIGIPEDPPALAYLTTESGMYELDVPRTGDSKLLADLESMNGKKVVVVGKWTIRRTLSKRHRAIRVDELRFQQ
jgi:hypothetical protein